MKVSLPLLFVAACCVVSCQSPDEIRLEHEQRLEKQTVEFVNRLTYARDRRGNCLIIDRQTWHFASIDCNSAK
ncbi:MAG: hypothetical protein RL755_17 [Pseudomonadota bacterium]|jgi:hypothetical protein